MAGYITVLLQKSNPDGDWGIKMGPLERAASVVITQIDESCVAAELLEAGDRIIEIEGMETSKLSVDELQGLLGNPSKRLSMVVLKKNLPKGPCTIRKTTTEEVSTVEETREEIERKKEYEVLLEVSPRQSLEDVMKNVRDKIERGEKLDAKEIQITSSFNKNVQQSTSQFDSTKHTIQRDYEANQQLQMLPRNSEIVKRKEKYMREQTKEEIVRCEKVKQEKLSMEEKKKKSSTFWTDPPSDLKNAINNNQYWKPSENNDPITTSAIFSHLNDLHNTLRKGSARDEKRKFWENCRKKYGVDPPGTKYNVSHRPDTDNRQDINRSRSCEPEHLDSQNPFRQQDYRQTNPFFSPSPTNPFYSECSDKTQSQESLRSSTGALPEYCKPCQSLKQENNMEDEKRKKKYEGAKTGALIVDCGEKIDQSNEAYREDFTSKCEFFERATSVPTTSCVKNAQDIVSERLGTTSALPLKKPSDFINKIQAENRKAHLRRSVSKEDTVNDSSNTQPREIERPRSSSLAQPSVSASQTTGTTLAEHKTFLGQNVLSQSVTGSMSTSSEQKKEVCLAQENNLKTHNVSSDVAKGYAHKVMHSAVMESSIHCEKSQNLQKEEIILEVKQPPQYSSMESEIMNHPIVIAAQQKEYADLQQIESNAESRQICLQKDNNITQISQTINKPLLEVKENKNNHVLETPISLNETAQQIEAQMKESMERIRAESEKLCSLNLGRENSFEVQSQQAMEGQFKTPLHGGIIPDSTAFPGMLLAGTRELQKRSFVETSYEKVTRTGTPYENVETAFKREFKVDTPSGFYENAGREEVFKQESRTEGMRETKKEFLRAEETLDTAYREIIKREGLEPTCDYTCGYTSEGLKSGEIQGGNGSMIQAGSE